MATAILSAERASVLFEYNPLTGVLTRKAQQRNKPITSDEVSRTNGYIRIRVDGVRYAAHRVAWLLHTGQWPNGEIDHINGDRSDNRIANLRDVSARTNRENQHGPRSDNLSSGVMGVHWSAYHSKWKAHIRVGGKLKHLKYCKTQAEAEAVYLATKRLLHKGCTI